MLFSACQSHSGSEQTDVLNEESYAYHYRNLDSTAVYARRALQLSGGYDAGKAEALNNLAFVDIMRMNFQHAAQLLDSVYTITDNQIELLVADVQHMRLCQRKSANKEFYDYYEQAQRRIARIGEERDMLSPHQKKRFVYAHSEFYIVTSTYFYYVGLEGQSIQALKQIDPDGEVRRDTAQLLAYYYNIGSGGIITQGSQKDIMQQEFEYLLRCYMTALRYHYTFWEANSLQAMSEHLQSEKYTEWLIANNLPAMKYINTDQMPDSLLAGNLAQRSLELFSAYGDVYQTAGAYRTLAQCFWLIKDYRSAIICLQDALNRNKAIEQAPDLVASICEQLSVTYSAIDDKPSSDYNRNLYLDLQEQTRQDRYFESRADQLSYSLAQLNFWIAAVLLAIIITILLLFLFNRQRKRAKQRYPIDSLLAPLRKWQHDNEAYMQSLNDRFEEINEEKAADEILEVSNKKRNLEQRAKISLMFSITPLIDRMLHEIKRLVTSQDDEALRQERYNYIAELTDQINEYNGVLTEWIQMRQGQLSLHIESFRLQQLFDIVKRSEMGFRLKGISLKVLPTTEYVKADKILTLFMINTIADNARKFTDKGGTVTISATSADNYVEVSVADNGKGMTKEELAGIFEKKIYNGHGFGLMNCRGIIDKYHKISKIFQVCTLSAESQPGKGSRFFFRLPKGLVKIIIALALLMPASPIQAKGNSPTLRKAQAFADSAYFCNINGHYKRTLQFADSAIYYLNLHAKAVEPSIKTFMSSVGSGSGTPAELTWFHKGLKTNYYIILDLRNESAVAALALHEWAVYQYNNKVYTQLFKEASADSKLGEYCRVMQHSEQNKMIAVIILILLLLLILPSYYFIYYRHELYYRFCVERIKVINDILLSDVGDSYKLRRVKAVASQRFPAELKEIVRQITEALQLSVKQRQARITDIELADDERKRIVYDIEKYHICNSVLDNCLSTLKHETMYYPSRIRQLVDGKDANLQSISELAAYYKELYTILGQQALRLTERVRPECHRFSVSSLGLHCNENSYWLWGDKDLIAYLFDILRKQNGGDQLSVSVTSDDDSYVSFDVTMTHLALNAQQCLDIFTPKVANLPYLLCRQIARDNGNATNHHGCGIKAVASERGTHIVIKLTKAR